MPASASRGEERSRVAEGRRRRPRSSPDHLSGDDHYESATKSNDLSEVRFRPAADERNVFRTVVITNLPPSLSMKRLLGRVRGGTIFSAVFLNTHTFKNSVGLKAALVTFMSEDSATEYTDYVGHYGLNFLSHKAYVTQLKTPTWPVPRSLLEGYPTRCLTIQNFPSNLSERDLEADLTFYRFSANLIEHMALRASGRVMQLRFTSIEAAVRAYHMLRASSRYHRSGTYFARDPCSYPLDELHSALEGKRDLDGL